MSIQIAQRIGSALGVSSATKLRELDIALREYVRSVGQGATVPLTGTLPYSSLTGVPATFPPSAHTHVPADVLLAATSRILGRITAGAGAAEELTAANVATILAAITQTWSGVHTFSAPIRLPGYTVATLPAGVQGYKAFVTDALAPAYGTAVVGGGAVVTPVFYNGAAWTCR